MSGIAGWLGRADPGVLDAMLAVIDYRGDTVDKHLADGIASRSAIAGGAAAPENHPAYTTRGCVLYLLGRAARAAGLTAVFNGEGGDQLFGGWTSKPMVAAAVYGNRYEAAEESPGEQYLRSYHRFYGLEDALYAAQLKEAVDAPGQRRALLRPYLGQADPRV